MGLFDQFPYTNFHELNLDWILKALKELEHTIEQFVAINALKYADPIQWNITSQYEKNTIVIDPQSGTAYISVQPVPSGVALTNEDYWTVVFDLGQFVVRASKNFANTYEAETTLTATVSTAAGGWIVWGDTLYKALVNITAGDSYVVGGNIAHFTMEDIIGHLEDLTTTDKSNVVAAINEVAAEVLGKIGDLANLTTTDKSNLVAAINEVVASITAETQARIAGIAAEAQARADADGNLSNLTTTDKSNLVAAINEVLATLAAEVLNRENADGNLSDLITEDKSNLVSAINEIAEIASKSYFVCYFPEAYGAIGDGVTDDTSAFVDMLNDIVTTNKHAIVFLQKEYLISDTLTVTTPFLTFYGLGGSQVHPRVFMSQQSSKTLFKVSAQGVNFYNLQLGGNYKNPGVYDGEEPAIGECNVVIDYDGSTFSSPYDGDAKVSNCNIAFCTTGILITARNIKVEDCLFLHCRTGVRVQNAPTGVRLDGTMITNNVFHSCHYGIYSVLDPNVYPCKMFVTNNLCEFTSIFATITSSNVVISNNYVSQSKTGYPKEPHINIMRSTNDNYDVIQGNMIDDPNGIRGIQTAAYVKNTIIKDNSIMNTPEEAIIIGNNCQNANVLNNNFTNCATDGNHTVMLARSGSTGNIAFNVAVGNVTAITNQGSMVMTDNIPATTP